VRRKPFETSRTTRPDVGSDEERDIRDPFAPAKHLTHGTLIED
jgi:hypothetical protein